MLQFCLTTPPYLLQAKKRLAAKKKAAASRGKTGSAALQAKAAAEAKARAAKKGKGKDKSSYNQVPRPAGTRDWLCVCCNNHHHSCVFTSVHGEHRQR